MQRDVSTSWSPVSRLFGKIAASLARDRDLPLRQQLVKGLRYFAAMSTACRYLRDCDQVGARARTLGRPWIENRGRIVIGHDFNLNSSFAASQISAGPQGAVEIGHGVAVNFGCVISAAQCVRIGDRVSIGPYSIIADSDRPDGAGGEAAAITIGDHVWLAGRVTVLPGAEIGAGSVITAGSIVAGAIPPGVVAGGIPARVLRPVDSGARCGLATTDGAASLCAPSSSVLRPPLAASIPHSALRTPHLPAAPTHRGLIIADFTADELARRLAEGIESPILACEPAPFGQVFQILVQPDAGNRDGRFDFAIVWTRPEAALPTFQALASFQPVELEAALQEVDRFCGLIAAAAKQYRSLFVPTWTAPAFQRGLGLIDLKQEAGLAHLLMRLNLRMIENLRPLPNVYPLNAQRWNEVAGREALNPKLWYMGKVPFHPCVFEEAARDIRAGLAGIAGMARKVIILDLDDTLWGGIVGDAGWQNLRLGGHDSIGEAFVDFQRHLKSLARRGILLALASKNEEAVALEAIRSHPEMVLRLEDFAGWRISWQDKAQNIVDLMAELNLGLQSAVFIDDNPVERARVREMLPEVFVPEWPEDRLLYSSTLLGLRCFDTPALSQEDRARAQMYASERQRESLKRELGSLDDWLATLGTRVVVEPLTPANLQRTAQLLNKTNQMNLATRRLTEPELADWVGAADHRLWTFTVSDRFGEAGLTGILSLALDGREARIVDFVISCRVIGRRIEETLLHVAVREAQRLGTDAVVARFLPTAKNKPCLEFWRGCGFACDEATQQFRWDAAKPYSLPSSVELALP
jgi:FkbH-like protein